MKYKLIALDLDGTLLDNNKNISSANLEALKKAKDNGAKVVIITGRSRSKTATQPFLDKLESRELTGYYQGALVVDEFDENPIYSCTLKRSDCKDIYIDAVKRGLNMQVYRGGDAFVEHFDEYSYRYQRHIKCKLNQVDSLEPLIDSDENLKLLINTSEKQVQRNFEYFYNKYSSRVNVVTSSKNYIEFTHRDATKGNALKFIASRYRIDRSEIIAMGDQLNDVSMIEFAGVGVAMGNAPDAIKAKADMVTLTNDEDGVKHALDILMNE
jgi:Cof subfamily protein (haloacid dehalogenase superfamily)